MPLTINYIEGDGVTDDSLNIGVQLPDTNGGNLTVLGRVAATGQAAMNVPTTTLAAPAAPASGSLYFNVQVDVTTGVATMQQSTSAPPPAISANNRIVYSQVLTATTLDPALDAGTTPDPTAGAV